jgi:glycosyltransferase involved in cell wall biosynthesis
MNLSVYILAYNESEKIRDCINTVLWADEIIVADSYSDDGTSQIAEEMGARVVHIDFEGYGKLRNQAIKHCNGNWILSIDSDERCTVEVRDEILSIIEKNELDIYFIPRKNFFMGRWIRYSGWYPNFRQPQLFKKGKMEYDLDEVHEGFISKSTKKIGFLEHAIWQFPFKNSEEILHKTNRYSSLGIKKLELKNIKASYFKAFIHAFWAFIKHYIFKLGFLDGGPGFIIAFGNFEGTFYRYIKYMESKSQWKPPKINAIHKKIK